MSLSHSCSLICLHLKQFLCSLLTDLNVFISILLALPLFCFNTSSFSAHCWQTCLRRNPSRCVFDWLEPLYSLLVCLCPILLAVFRFYNCNLPIRHWAFYFLNSIWFAFETLCFETPTNNFSPYDLILVDPPLLHLSL